MNNYFCVLPFFGAEYAVNNSFTSCCLLPKNHNIKTIQNSMLNNHRPEECSKCWKLEDQGLVSDRQIKNSSFDFYTNQSIETIEEKCRNHIYSPQILKIYTSNLCNSTCVTCGPSNSTKWQALEKIPITKKILDDKSLDAIDWSNIKMLTFVGGEPLLEKKNLDILQHLSEVNDSCFISLVTNGSVSLTDSQKQSFSKFKNLNICLSIDGVERQFEYLRYPLKWTDLLENINEYKKIGCLLSVSFTISNLNILYYNTITDWFKSQNLPYNHIVVSYPTEFNIENLPPEIKKPLPLIKDKINFDINLFSRFVKNIESQDNIKNISIKDYLPEYAEMIEKFKCDYSVN